MGDGNLKTYTFTNAKETNKRTRFRRFTEAEMYRPLSQLYDAVEAQSSSKRLRTWGWTLLSNGATHLIMSFTSDLEGKTLWIIKRPDLLYHYASVAFIAGGILCLVLSSTRQYKPVEKEALLSKYLDQEFSDDESASSETSFADDVIDYREVVSDDSVVAHQHHPKHKLNHNQADKPINH